MDNGREKLGSRLGFILLSAGCAIGCGNVWKFPWMTGQYGGGGFVLVYVLCLLLLGLPALTMEFAVGRAAQASPVKMYQKLEKPGQKWHIHGYVALLGNLALMAFYTVVTGWMIYYFVMFLLGKSADLGFVAMITNPTLNVGYLAIAVALGFLVLSFDLQGGLERVTKYLMVALFALMLILAVHSALLPGAKEGLSFYLVPDFSKINGSVIVGAMNQAFFTLSIGIGSMAIFGSYIGKERALMGESVNIILLDTFVAIMAGFIMFPACFTYGIEVNAGQIALKVSKGDVATQLTVEVGNVTIDNGNLLVSGYVTTSQLNTVDGRIDSLLSGNTTATTLKATNAYLGANGSGTVSIYGQTVRSYTVEDVNGTRRQVFGYTL